MGLFENIDRLINERGSANILRERLLLASDKYSALEKKNIDLENEKGTLQAKIQILEAENQRLKFDNAQLTAKIQNLETLSSGHSDRLDDTKVSILIFLAKYDKPIIEQIARSLNVNDQIIKFHITELENSKMIHSLLTMGAPARWSLSHAGRKYLIENKLIS